MSENNISDNEIPTAANEEYVNEVLSLLRSAKDKGFSGLNMSERFVLTEVVNRVMCIYEKRVKAYEDGREKETNERGACSQGQTPSGEGQEADAQ